MRTVNRVATAVLGLVLLAVGLVAAVAIAVAAAGRTWVPFERWGATLRETLLRDPAVLWVSVGVAVIGLAVLLFQLRPWPPELVEADRRPDEGAWLLSRRAVERRVADAAGSVNGVRHARAAIRGRSDRWRVAVKAEGDPGVRDAVSRAVRGELSNLGATPGSADVVLSAPRG